MITARPLVEKHQKTDKLASFAADEPIDRSNSTV
jgi:hypothetical protein